MVREHITPSFNVGSRFTKAKLEGLLIMAIYGCYTLTYYASVNLKFDMVICIFARSHVFLIMWWSPYMFLFELI